MKIIFYLNSKVEILTRNSTADLTSRLCIYCLIIIRLKNECILSMIASTSALFRTLDSKAQHKK